VTPIRITRDKLSAVFGPHGEPVARVRSGDSIVFDTEDARRGETRTAERTTPAYLREMWKRGWQGNPVTGPVFVEGADPGDTLAVHVHEVRCDTLGFTTNWPHLMQMSDWFSDPETVLMPIDDGTIRFDERVRIPVRPMIGTIGTAPAREVLSTGTSGPHGGNLDVPEVAAGNTVLLPVEVPGALFALGDCHARQNDGETRAVEMRAEVTVTVEVVPGRPHGIAWPRIETSESFVTVGCAVPLENALTIAVRQMVVWVESLTGWSKAKCLNLIGLVADCRPGQAIAGIGIPHTMRCIMPRSYLAAAVSDATAEVP
jgi:amidase